MVAIVFDVDEELILPCPFCGEKELHVEGDSEPAATVQVYCDNPDCEAEGPHGVNPDDAVRKWNARSLK